MPHESDSNPAGLAVPNRPFLRDLEPEMPEKAGYQLARLRPIHRRICRLAAIGLNNVEIAEKLEISVDCVSYTIQGNLGAQMVMELEDEEDNNTADTIQGFRDMHPEILEVFNAAISGSLPGVTPSLRIKAAGEALDRSGVPRATASNVSHEGEVVLRRGIDEVKERAAAHEIAQHKVIEVEAIEVSRAERGELTESDSDSKT